MFKCRKSVSFFLAMRKGAAHGLMGGGLNKVQLELVLEFNPGQFGVSLETNEAVERKTGGPLVMKYFTECTGLDG